MIAKKILEGNSHLSLGTMPKSPPQTSEVLQSPFKAGVDLINIHEVSVDGRSGAGMAGASAVLDNSSSYIK